MNGTDSDSPTALPAVDPADFRKAVELGETVLADGADDDAMERLAEAYGEYFGADRDLVLSMIVRFFALGSLLDSSRLEPWIEPVPDDPESAEVADAVLYVAADAPLDEAGEFEADEFLDRLEGIAPSRG